MLQELLEAEMTEHIGAPPYEHASDLKAIFAAPEKKMALGLASSVAEK